MWLGTNTKITTMNVNVPCKSQNGMINQNNLNKKNTPSNTTMHTPHINKFVFHFNYGIWTNQQLEEAMNA